MAEYGSPYKPVALPTDFFTTLNYGGGVNPNVQFPPFEEAYPTVSTKSLLYGNTGYGPAATSNEMAPAGSGNMMGDLWNSFKEKLSGINWMDKTDLTTNTKTQGAFGPTLGALQGLGNFYLGMQQYGLAKDTFNENKRQFELNFDAQRKTTNYQLEGRKRASEIAKGNSNVDATVAEHMKKYGI